MCLDPGRYIGLRPQVEGAAVYCLEADVLPRQAPHDRGADHSSMAGYPDVLTREVKFCQDHRSSKCPQVAKT
jgi:hypothetical protein